MTGETIAVVGQNSAALDHRLIDGKQAVLFLRRIKEAIEEPARMLVEV